jgi:hypothetical protein
MDTCAPSPWTGRGSGYTPRSVSACGGGSGAGPPPARRLWLARRSRRRSAAARTATTGPRRSRGASATCSSTPWAWCSVSWCIPPTCRTAPAPLGSCCRWRSHCRAAQVSATMLSAGRGRGRMVHAHQQARHGRRRGAWRSQRLPRSLSQSRYFVQYPSPSCTPCAPTAALGTRSNELGVLLMAAAHGAAVRVARLLTNAAICVSNCCSSSGIPADKRAAAIGRRQAASSARSAGARFL